MPHLIAALTGFALLGLFSLRAVGMYSHQALAFVLLLGAAWVVPSRLYLVWRGELRPLLRQDDDDAMVRARRRSALGRAFFWGALVGALGLIWPRATDLDGMLWGLMAVGAVRIAAELFPPRAPNLATTVVLVLAGCVLVVDTTRVFLPPPAPRLILEPPFEGTWVVLQGGRSPLVSHHLTAYNQHYAVDLMSMDARGNITVPGADPADANGMWHAWDQPYVAPVAGTVVVARDDVPDVNGPSMVARSEDAAGNLVVIETAEGLFVVLAHLKQGSLAVAVGDVVTPGQALARCGNTGNTTQPHLHLQVQTHADLWDPDNRSVPFAFAPSGRVPSRSDRVEGRPRE